MILHLTNCYYFIKKIFMKLKISNIEICYEVINQELLSESKPLLVFLHEGLGSIGQWHSFPRIIAEKSNLPALVYDRRGYGGSSELESSEPDIYYLHNEADFLHKILENLKVNNPIILFGHSDGATIALIYASLFNENVLGVVTEAPHIFIEEMSVVGIKKSIEYYENSDFKQRLQKYHSNDTDKMFYRWANTWISEEAAKYDFVEEIKRIESPVLVIQGKNDHYVSEKQAEMIKKYNTKSKIIIDLLEDCGHTPHKDQENITVEKTVEFLNKLRIESYEF